MVGYLYRPRAMKAAYSTFLASLLVIRCHDLAADQAAAEFDVSWSRTTPVVVSTLDDALEVYITGESDHRMGMDVFGDPNDVWAFRFACSLAFSPIEYGVVHDPTEPTGLSVTIGLGERILNGEIPELFMSNGYIVFKIEGKDDLILLLDPVTGIVTDCAHGISGVYCFHDQITNNIIQKAIEINSPDPNERPEWSDLVNDVSISLGGIASMLGAVVYEERTVAAAELIAPLMLPLMTTKLINALRPGSMEEAESNGLFNHNEYLNDLMSQYWGESGPTPEFWDKLKEALEKYYHDITPSQSDIEKEIPENLMCPPELSKDYNFMTYGYGGYEGDDIWLHYKVVRTPTNNDCWVIECSIVYYVGDKSYRETQYAVLLPGTTISMLYEGDQHTFKFKIPNNAQGGIIESHTIIPYCFQRI